MQKIATLSATSSTNMGSNSDFDRLYEACPSHGKLNSDPSSFLKGSSMSLAPVPMVSLLRTLKISELKVFVDY